MSGLNGQELNGAAMSGKITGTFDEIWNQGMEANAKALGVRDGDLPKVRAKVKNLFISAGWASPEGDVEFVSQLDAANALQAARKELSRVAERVAHEGKVVRATAGTTPTKSQVLSASAGSDPTGPTTATIHTSHTIEAGAFAPKMGKVGDRCPRCMGSMEPVGLANGKGAIYCTRDRVVVPLSQDTQVRY